MSIPTFQINHFKIIFLLPLNGQHVLNITENKNKQNELLSRITHFKNSKKRVLSKFNKCELFELLNDTLFTSNSFFVIYFAIGFVLVKMRIQIDFIIDFNFRIDIWSV